ncbi:type IX secretion/gliding motility protein PorT/SprT [Halpernia frigidisoli]|uniref:Probable protein-translocating porin PorT n=1 Tax=Halpernia frigidisoli TaxID=1125876 RepID=A0A1I3DE14_9FLAO|nr:porin family protein [Halpernia frigidisoli]SFH84965.1 probable protein-translocating porin PorT [Halpernia frigidisoli]
MSKLSLKITAIVLFSTANFFHAQLFKTKDRMDNLEGVDDAKLSYGFFLNANQYDYKIVLDPKYGINGNKNLVQSKTSASFGAGLIGKARLNDNFDLRLEPGLQFVERELTFDTQSNDQFAAGTPTNQPFTPLALTDADRIRKVKSTYLDIPLLLEFHGDRWYNSRPYAAVGVNYSVNLQSNSASADDNQQGIFRSTTTNFGYTAELGIQFYFSRFKLTPAFRGTFFTNNEVVADNPGTPPYWAAAISTMQTRAFMFVLKFE